MHRKQSYVSCEGFSVLFDGSKTFWKTRSNLDILIASHTKMMCIEVITYDAVIGKEAPRIYFATALLFTKIDREECDRKLAIKKETFMRQKKNFNQSEVHKDVVNEAMIQFILSRLSVIVSKEVADDFAVVLSPLSTDTVDEETGFLDVICPKPESLVPVEVNYVKKATAGDMKTALKQLDNETKALQRATKMCELVTSSVDGFKLMLAEKMRLDAELKAMYSDTRLRWIGAINRILVQNFIAKVHERLMRSEVRDWYLRAMEKVAEFERQQQALQLKKEAQAEFSARERGFDCEKKEEEEEEEEDFSVLGDAKMFSAKVGGPGCRNRISPARSKMLRRSLDNSQLLIRQKSGSGSGISLPHLSPTNSNSGGGIFSLPSPTSGKVACTGVFAAKPVLPMLPNSSQKFAGATGGGGGGSNSLNDAMERRRLARAGKGFASPIQNSSEGRGGGGTNEVGGSSSSSKKRAAKMRRSFTEGVSSSHTSLFAVKSSSIDTADYAFGKAGAGVVPEAAAGSPIHLVGGERQQQQQPNALLPRTPPSLMKSYSETVPKLLEPVSLSAFGDVTRSAKTKRPSLEAPR